ncbi:hypothetical protein PLEOSDRAFT_1099676 [Pleurotus ostreatus PC15]|uniref:Uncharacterized protein n=1 Tax=Pleurotus ostreatus (strain PC15) TaxID=1137138 RepID=A0A067P381_PLEO1|nr:hypothetical protein PLEOSDRAFT_1099676 [Pleurotus ostreatus PC15]
MVVVAVQGLYAHCSAEANDFEGNFGNDQSQPRSIRGRNGISDQVTLSDGTNGFVDIRAQARAKDEARQPRAGEVNDENQIATRPEDKCLPNPSCRYGRIADPQWPVPKDLSNARIPEGGTYNIVFSSDSLDVYVLSCPRRLGPEMRVIDGCTTLVLNDRQACKPLKLHARAAFALPSLDNLESHSTPSAISSSSSHYDSRYFGKHRGLITPTPAHTRDVRHGQETAISSAYNPTSPRSIATFDEASWIDFPELAALARPLLGNPELDTIIQLLDESLHNHPKTPAARSVHGALPASPTLAGALLDTADAIWWNHFSTLCKGETDNSPYESGRDLAMCLLFPDYDGASSTLHPEVTSFSTPSPPRSVYE